MTMGFGGELNEWEITVGVGYCMGTYLSMVDWRFHLVLMRGADITETSIRGISSSS